jgi:hypothetical protein
MGANSCSAGSLAACGNLVGAGTLVNDPFLSNPVMRLTDNTTSRADQPNVTNVADISGSGDEMHFSCDSSMVTVGSINSWAFPMNFTWGSAPTKMYATSFGNGGLYFSGANGGMAWGHVCPSNANVLYILNGTVLGHYNLAGNCPTCTAPSVVTDFDFASSANCLGTYTSTWADFGGGDQFDTDYAVGFSKTGGQGTGTKLAVWRKGFGCRVLDTSTDTVTGDWGPTGVIPGTPCTGTIHNDKIAKVGGSAGSVLWAITGASAGCGTSAATQPWQWNYASSTLTGSISSACTGVHCSGHWTEGLSTFANNPGDVAPNALTVRPLTTPGTGTGITPVYPVVAPTDSHFGWNQLIDSQPFLGTFSRFTGLPPVAAWENEVVGFQPISSGKQYRFASTYNTGVSPYFSTQYAIGSVSQDGKYFIFSSDWMNTLGSISGGSTCVPHGPNWAASTVYAATPYLSSFPANGGVIKPTSGNAGGYSYKASTAGTSGLAPPTWPQTVGGTVADGSTLVWTNVDAEGTTKACRGDVFVVLLQ